MRIIVGGKGGKGGKGWGPRPGVVAGAIVGAACAGAAITATRPARCRAGRGTTTTVVVQNHPAPVPEASLRQLAEMGFGDRELNIAALKRNNNDINAAVAWLSNRQTVVVQQPSAPPPPPPPYQEPSSWEATVDPATKRTYYFDRVTGQTSWERPAGMM